MADLLIYTADNEFADALGRALRREGHFCKMVQDETTALQEVRARGLSLILLDDAPALPKVGEMKNWTILPILLLIEPDRLLTVRIPPQAEDVLVKPVREEELLYRVRNLCRRSASDAEGGRALKNKGLTIDENRYEIRLDGELIDLTYREFELLKHLINNPGRVFDREQLLNLVWGVDYLGGPRTVDVHVRRIRSKIEIRGYAFISTVRGVGYKFIGES